MSLTSPFCSSSSVRSKDSGLWLINWFMIFYTHPMCNHFLDLLLPVQKFCPLDSLYNLMLFLRDCMFQLHIPDIQQRHPDRNPQNRKLKPEWVYHASSSVRRTASEYDLMVVRGDTMIKRCKSYMIDIGWPWILYSPHVQSLSWLAAPRSEVLPSGQFVQLDVVPPGLYVPVSHSKHPSSWSK